MGKGRWKGEVVRSRSRLAGTAESERCVYQGFVGVSILI